MNEFDLENSRWTPIERVADRVNTKGYKEAYWLMKCECGVQREVCWGNYTSGRSRSCGCYRREVSKGKRTDARTLPFGMAARNNLFLIYKRGATKRDLCFNLSLEDFTELVDSDCVYCGKPPNRCHYPVANGINGGYLCNGIDRRDNTVGYTLDNCIPACTECNRGKGVLTFEEYIDHLDALVKFRSSL